MKVSVPKQVVEEAKYEGCDLIVGAKTNGCDYVLKTNIGFMAFTKELGYWRFLGTFKSSDEAWEELRFENGEEDEENY